MTDIFLRPVTDAHVIILRDPTVADAVVEPEVVVVSGGGGVGYSRYWESHEPWLSEKEDARLAKIRREDDEILCVITAFIRELLVA